MLLLHDESVRTNILSKRNAVAFGFSRFTTSLLQQSQQSLKVAFSLVLGFI
jgi:hypothetical protein